MYGIILFAIFYIIAANLYPGGSQVNKYSEGFSWTDNYWCTLLNEQAVNGKLNAARPVALAAMFLLCLSLSLFWYIFPQYSDLNKNTKLMIQISGTLAMSITMFLFTSLHDVVIIVAGFFGIVALLGTFFGLYKNKWHLLLLFGILNLLLIALNNYVYWTNDYIRYLPVIQKISFLSFLIWICCITLNLYRMNAKKKNI